MLAELRQPGMRLLSASLWITHVFMAWKALCLITLSPHPVQVIISASMEPTFQRGDLIFLWNRPEMIRVGDIPVIWFEGAPLPMTHRAIKVLWADESGRDDGVPKQLILTKGDNNELDDVALYPIGQKYAYRHQVIGVVRWYIPWLGWPTIWLNELPYLRNVLIGLLLLACLI
ncbi:signal peptidase I [Sarocladium implicatum]|nr:signal peptidase I [Sarocladium implicatum]